MSMAGVAMNPIRDESVLSPGHFSHTEMDSTLNESIIIYLAMSGSMVPMRVLESDSIESVKLRIQTCKGFGVKNQKLVYKGRELARNNSLVRDYGVIDGNVLHLVLKLSDLKLVNVKSVNGKEFNFNVEKSRDVAYVKQQIAEKFKGLFDAMEQKLLLDGKTLEDRVLVHDICNNSDGAVIHLFVRKSAEVRTRPVDKSFELSIVASNLNKYEFEKKKNAVSQTGSEEKKEYSLEPVIVNPGIVLSKPIKDLIKSTFDGLNSGNFPIRSSEGTGGTYLMKDSSGKKYLSVFKPIDEEPLAVNNPRGLPVSTNGEGLKRGTVVGEGALREVAAYILDHPINGRRSFSSNEEMGFAGVPPTFMVKCLHQSFNHPNDVSVKIGSLQKFIENEGSCEDMGPGGFPVREVHKISVLDIRLANADRHAGNILIGKNAEDGGQTMLIPIDHGYCLPESFEDCTFDWLYWPQARQPYTKETIEYIKSLDAEQDIALLKFYGWEIPSQCARTLRISTMLLKKGAERDLTPFTIGNMMCRENINKESVIEAIVQEAHESVLPGTSEAAFMDSVSQIMDRYLDISNS